MSENHRPLDDAVVREDQKCGGEGLGESKGSLY